MKKILFGLILVVLLIIVGRALSLGISGCSPISNHKSAISNRGMSTHQLFLQALELLEEPVCSNLSLVSPVNDYFWLNQPILASSFISNSQKTKCNHGFHGLHSRINVNLRVRRSFSVGGCQFVAVPPSGTIPKRE